MQPSFGDKFIGVLDNGLKTLLAPSVAERENPAAASGADDSALTEDEKRESARLMRVNHCGEVCAQALYQGHALFSRDEAIAAEMSDAAREEIDHLAWTAERVHELGGRQSILNPVWYGASFLLGAAASAVSDKICLGFVAETENQVSEHLNSHLQRLPENDQKSRAIVAQMDEDERQHASKALELGGAELPPPVKSAMRAFGRVMTRTSYWL